ncbi:MAG: hypothetical protein JNK89_04080 [Saprospiraceae bacterium]|nr:hypothetical protein [Saprospiraceae bacterium]
MELQPFFTAFSAALGWAVFHSIWQITVLYLLYRLAAWRWPGNSRMLYLLACTGMAAAAVCAAGSLASTWLQRAEAQAWPEVFDGVALPAPVAGIPAPAAASQPTSWYALVDNWYARWAGSVGMLWCLGALLLSLRLAGGYWALFRLRQTARPEIPARWLGRLACWREKLGIARPVRWLVSECVQQPLTVGFWKPMVLFPAGLALHLPPEQVELLLLHELAHIRRHDYLVNLFQLALEVCFFYNPLFWRLSNAARRQREFCCDAMVLRHLPDRLAYAQTLVGLQQHSLTLNQFAMQALGKSAFAQRIVRIVHFRPGKARHSPAAAFLLLLLLAAVAWSRPAIPGLQALKPASEIALVLPAKQPALAHALAAPTGSKPERLQTMPTPVMPDTSSPLVVAVEADKMNVFYIGIDNPITVAVPGYDCADLQIVLSGGGVIQAAGNCQYLVQVRQPGTVKLEIFAGKKGARKQLGVRTFRVKRIPDPVTRLDGFRGNSVRKAEIRGTFNRELTAALDYFEFDAQCTIAGFTVVFWTADSTVVEFPVIGNRIPADRLEALEQTPAGRKIYILDVKSQCPGDTVKRNLGDLVFEIRE